MAAGRPGRDRAAPARPAGGRVTLLVSAGWWVLLVELWPASSRPYIGGSQHNSVLELVFGYNGFGRLTGDETGSVGGGPGGGWGQTGITRLFGAEMGGEAAWLLPAALVLLGALSWRTRRAPRTDPLRAAVLVWGGWLLVTGLVFSFMAGIVHSYYLVALAPAIAALVGIGVGELWRDRGAVSARITLAAVLAGTAAWAWVLLQRTPSWQPWLGWTVLVAGIAAALALLGVHRVPRVVVAAVAALAVLAGLAGPGAYSVATAATPHTGAIPTSGPAGAGLRGFGGGFGAGFGGGAGLVGRHAPGGGAMHVAPPGGTGRGGGNTGSGGLAGLLGGGASLFGGARGGVAALLDSPAPGAELTALLRQDASRFTWVAAAVGSNSAAGYQLATGRPVMALGGFNGTDPAPTLAEFQALVAAGEIHYFVGGGMAGGAGGTGGGRGGDTGGSDDARQIATWVQQTFTPTTVAGVTLYDVSTGTAS